MKRNSREDNRIVDNRGMRKSIHVGKKHRRMKPAVKAVIIATVIVFLLAIVAVAVLFLLKNEGNNNTVSSDVVSNNKIEENNNYEIIIGPQEETVSEDKTEEIEEEILAENDFLNNVTPTSFDINWDGMLNDSYYVCYSVSNAAEENHGKAQREDKSMNMSEICTAYHENSSDLYLTRVVSINNATITGLMPETEYEVMVLDMEGNEVSENKVTTTASGYCDPFKDIDSVFTYSLRDEVTGQIIEKVETKTVKMSSVSGCLGAEARLMVTTAIYSDSELNNESGSVKVESPVVITEDENGHYCYLKADGTYTVYIAKEDGSKGWINARHLMIDAKKLYTPENDIYGIQINRTNSTGSIFTAGGDVMRVDNNPDVASKFNAILSNDPSVYMTVSGNNIIDNITGNILPNYGTADVMPVVWDLALELKQCQKNALENGFTLLMYEGYRPASSSLAVYNSLSNSGYLAIEINGTNLAQGFLTDQRYGVSFYIAKSSRHNRGIATDITIMNFASPDELGIEVPMQSKMHTLDYRCNMHYNTWQADLLTDIMIGHGSHLEYLAVRSEWWHFQLKTDRKDLYPLIDEYKYMDFVF